MNDLKSRLILAILIPCPSCCDTYVEVTYEYEGTMIKRVDECGISAF